MGMAWDLGVRLVMRMGVSVGKGHRRVAVVAAQHQGGAHALQGQGKGQHPDPPDTNHSAHFLSISQPLADPGFAGGQVLGFLRLLPLTARPFTGAPCLMALCNLTPSRRGFLKFTAAIAMLSGHASFAQAPPSFTVAAASDLKFVLDDLTASFEKQTGLRVRVIYGSSGQLYAQLLQGAPFHVFMSADESLVFRLAQAGLTPDPGKVYAQGRLALIAPKGAVFKVDSELNDLRRALTQGRIKRFAIANPEHAPYGQRAVEALKHAGLWSAMSDKLVLGDNVSQALQFALSGSAQGGIVAHSLALAPTILSQSDHALVDAAWHQPLIQRMVLLKQAPASAQAFYDHLSTPTVRAVMSRYGFALPPA